VHGGQADLPMTEADLYSVAGMAVSIHTSSADFQMEKCIIVTYLHRITSVQDIS